MSDNTKNTTNGAAVSESEKLTTRDLKNLLTFMFWSGYIVLVTEFLICRFVAGLFSAVLGTTAAFILFLISSVANLISPGSAGVNFAGMEQDALVWALVQASFTVSVVNAGLMFLKPIMWFIRLQALIYWFSARKEEWFPNNSLKAAIKIGLEYFTETKKEVDESADFEAETSETDNPTNLSDQKTLGVSTPAKSL